MSWKSPSVSGSWCFNKVCFLAPDSCIMECVLRDASLQYNWLLYCERCISPIQESEMHPFNTIVYCIERCISLIQSNVL